MSNVKWIKIVVDIFDDEKILLIESMPDSDSMIVIWFKLLSLAGKINNGGVLMLNDQIAYTDEMLATIFRRKISSVKLAINTFESLGMILVINDTITIPYCWICKDQGMVFYSKMIGGISYNFAYRCNCKLGQAPSDSIPTISTVLTEKTAIENYRKFSKEFKN